MLYIFQLLYTHTAIQLQCYFYSLFDNQYLPVKRVDFDILVMLVSLSYHLINKMRK